MSVINRNSGSAIFDTFTIALTKNMRVGQVCIVNGQLTSSDGLGAQYEVKANGSGGVQMSNGNELVILDGETLKPESVANIAGLTGTKDNSQISLKGWHPDSDVGGGTLYWDSAALKSTHNGGTIFSPTVPWTTTTADYLNAVGETDGAGTGVWVRLDASDRFNVYQFGAIGNGATSDLASFTAINSATVGKFIIPAGSFYLESGGLTFPTSCNVTGDGRQDTLIKFDGLTSTLFNITPTDSYWRLSDIRIFHTQIGGAPTGGAAVTIGSSGGNGTVSNLWIENIYNGIVNTDGQNIDFYNIDMWGFINFGFHFLGGNVNDHTIKDCFMNGTATAVGIRLQNRVQALMVSNMEIVNCNYPMSTETSSDTRGNRPAYCKFVNCFFDSGDNGVYLDKVVDFRFTNCWFSNRPENGCDVRANADGIVFDNCDFMNSDKHGCKVFAGAVRVKFLGCDFIGNSVATTNTYNGIEINAGVTDFVIQGCTFNSDANYGFGTQKYGVNVNTGASDRYIIADNLVSGNGTAGLVDNGTGVNKRVANNY